MGRHTNSHAPDLEGVFSCALRLQYLIYLLYWCALRLLLYVHTNTPKPTVFVAPGRWYDGKVAGNHLFRKRNPNRSHIDSITAVLHLVSIYVSTKRKKSASQFATDPRIAVCDELTDNTKDVFGFSFAFTAW